MVKIKYDSQLMKTMSVFEQVTHAKLKDAIDQENRILFVTEENEAGRAIGRHHSNSEKLARLLKRKIKIVEFNPDIKEFIRNLVHPLNTREIEETQGTISISAGDSETKRILIGRDAKNLKDLTAVVKRFFDIQAIRIV